MLKWKVGTVETGPRTTREVFLRPTPGHTRVTASVVVDS